MAGGGPEIGRGPRASGAEGIFVDTVMRSLKGDPEEFAREHYRQESENAARLDHLCRAVDKDGDGKMKQEEFELGMQKKHIPLMLYTLGLRRHQVIEFYKLMAEDCDHNGEVDIEAFVNGCMLLKGSATNFDLSKLHAKVTASHAELAGQMNDIVELLDAKL